jgi:protein TonB
MDLGRRHWTVALGAALVAHAGIAAALLWQAPESGARQAGLGGIEVSLGPAGGAPGEPVPAAEVTEAQAAEAAPAPAEAPVAETAPAPPPEEVPTAPPVTEPPPEEPPPQEPPPQEPVEQVSVEEPPAEEPPVPEAPRQPQVAEPVEAPEVETTAVEPPPPPVEQVSPVRSATPPVPEAPEPAAAPAEAPEPAAAPAEAPEPETVAALSAPLSGSRGKAGTQESEAAGSAESRSGGGRPGAAADYAAVLRAWLEKHKEYPRRAQRRRQEGMALLHFVMDRDGRVLDYRIQESSGHALLDREVERMIERAQPLPEMPAEMQQARLELVVPVQFLLR